MPYARKRRSSGLMPGVNKLARAVNAQMRDAKVVADASRAAELASAMAGSNGPLSHYESNRSQRRQTYGGLGMYTGHGGFFSDLGGKVGNLFGPGFGDMGSVGRQIGSIGDMFAGKGGYRGKGAYDEGAHNSLVNASTGIGVPAFASSGGESGSMCITHREFVADIYGNPAGQNFVVQTYAVNPGLQQSMPWLSQIACNYDEYTLKQCMYTYRSVVSDIGSSTNGQVGTVIMATNYNAASAPFPDKQTMMEYEGSMSAKTTEHQIQGIECDPTKKSMGPEGLYVRTNPVLIGQDRKTYDWGLFNLAVSNTPSSYANQIIGELWVSYTVELRKPKYFVNRGLANYRDDFASNCVFPYGTVINPFYIASTPAAATSGGPLIGQQNSIGCLLATGGTTAAPTLTCTFPATLAGLFRLTFTLTLTGLTPTSTMSTLVSSFTGNVVGVGDINSYVPIAWGVGITGATNLIIVIDVNVSNASQGVNNALILTGGTASFIVGGTLANPTNSVRTQVSIIEVNPSGLVLAPGQTLSSANGNITFINSAGTVVSPA